jgi:HEAT repeat protein
MEALLHTGRSPEPEEFAALVDCLAESNRLLQRRAAETLARLGENDDRVVGELRALLKAQREEVRWVAAFALSRMRVLPADGIEILIEALGRDDSDLRWAAATMLTELAAREGDRVISRLVGVLRAGALEQRKMALYCLRDIGVSDPAVREAAEQALRESKTELRLAALSVLSRLFGDLPETQQRVVALLRDHDSRMRRAAAASFGQMSSVSEEVVEALRDAQHSDDPGLRRAAERALRQLAVKK